MAFTPNILRTVSQQMTVRPFMQQGIGKQRLISNAVIGI